MREAQNIEIDGHDIKLTNPDKVLFDNGITKRDLVEYYLTAAAVMLPLMRDRPVVMMRYPDGISGQRIVQKNTPDYFPEWINRAKVPKRDGGVVSHVLCEDAATLGYLASQACIEPHIFLSRSGSLDSAQEVVFDLDPPGADSSFDPVRRSALVLRDLLESELGMTSFVKTTGGHGLHVHLPLDGQSGFDRAREFARGVGELLAARHADTFTTSQRISGRAGRIYVDVMRNAFAQTVVTPYGVRGRPGAHVATPLAWTEVADPSLRPSRFGLRDVPERLAEISAGKDPWAGFWRRRYGVAAALRKLASLR